VNESPLLAGQTVTAGEYECAACGERVEIEEGAVTNLPVCPSCQNDTWKAR
jgi:predicted RNA-binding Zn-ribbon protein involved in translation (DUF1610 family)